MMCQYLIYEMLFVLLIQEVYLPSMQVQMHVL